jgi:hypothetical protein
VKDVLVGMVGVVISGVLLFTFIFILGSLVKWIFNLRDDVILVGLISCIGILVTGGFLILFKNVGKEIRRR